MIKEEIEDARVRTYVKNGKNFTVEQRDPYGFCYVLVDDVASTPEEFNGAFTTFSEAEQAIEIYANKAPKATVKKLEAKLI